jgi:hypothetical protein
MREHLKRARELQEALRTLQTVSRQ